MLKREMNIADYDAELWQSRKKYVRKSTSN